MQTVVTPAEMADADRRAIAAGTPESVLVERAGAAVARHALRMLGRAYGKRVVVVHGKGNNGADGLVAARLLRRRGVGVDVVAITGQGVVAARDGVDHLARAVARADLAIDAMFGTGFRGELTGAAVDAAARIGRLPTLAVDIPSGVDGTTGEVRGPAVHADETVCFAALKPGLLFEPGRSRAGRVHVADIGIPVGSSGVVVLDPVDVYLPRRSPSVNKWGAGALVIGGSTGMIGAPVMAAHAAARSGAGMVVCAVPGREAATSAGASSLVVRVLPATDDGALNRTAAEDVLKDVTRFAAVAIGPGLGRDPSTQDAVRRIVAECPVPIVVDADALNALATDPAAFALRKTAGLPPAILTPHDGEFARLSGAPAGPDRIAESRRLAEQTHAIVVHKGPGTVVAAPDGRVVVDRAGTSALAAAGTGDVLTGVIAGLLANGAAPFDAAASGVYVHGCAGTEAGTGDELVAIDLLDALHPTLDLLRAGLDHSED